MINRKLIVIEGLDGSGKATQSALLTFALQRSVQENKEQHRIRQVSFPDYDSPSSSLVKMYLAGDFGSHPDDVNAWAASSFYAVDRYASFKRDWAADWEQGIIVADRYTTSNAIHQCSKLPVEQWDAYLNWLFDFEYDRLGIPAPSLVIYLRVDPEVSQKLLAQRYHGHMEKEDIHEKDEAYLSRCLLAATYCADKLGWRTVDCTRDGHLRAVEDIHAEIMDIVNSAILTE